MAPVEKSGKPSETEIKAIKGFNLDWTCRGFQYEIGKTYTHDGPVVRCTACGFHAVEGYPLEIFDYYPPGTSRYADVSLGGEIARDDSDSKVAAARITVHVEIQISEIIARAVKWVFERAISSGKAHTDEPNQAASSTGTQGAAFSVGYEAKASGGKGSWLTIAEWAYDRKKSEYNRIDIQTVRVDGKNIKADTFYQLKGGEFVEAK